MVEQRASRASADADAEPGQDPGPPANKRRRIGLACNACRVRKSRCDGHRPSCTSCLSLGFDCQYDPGDSVTNVMVRKDYVSDLEQRVTSVEHKLQRMNDVLKGHLLPCPVTSPCRPSSAAPFAGPAGPADAMAASHATGLEEPQDEDASPNGMAMTFLEEQSSAFFGESSNINFTQLLFRAIAAVRQTPPAVAAAVGQDSALGESIASLSQGPAYCSVAPSAAPSNSVPTMLPSVAEMDHFLDVYFDSAGAVFPFIHEETMRNTYAECKQNKFTRARRTWLGTLNMIFATASSFDRDAIPSAKKRLETSNIFYRRALELCGDLSKRVISLEIVHYLLLVVIHCQGTQRSVQAWNNHGLVIRSALALGLHSDATRKTVDPIQDEVRRRTWVVIYCLDKVLSVAFGRPASIPDELMAGREPVGSPSPLPPNVPGAIDDLSGHVLVFSFKLYQIMAKSLVDQYGTNLDNVSGKLDIDALKASGELRKMLESWVARLPPYLRLCKPDSSMLAHTNPANRFRVILTLRHHNLSILIHKPLLSATIRHLFRIDNVASETPPYLIQLAMAEAHECIQAAQLTIDIVHTIIASDQSIKNNLGAWFFTLYYVFTASLVISGRLLWAQYGQSVVDEAAVRHSTDLLGKVEMIFHQLDHENSLVLSCLEYIRRLARLCGIKGLTMSDGEVRSNAASTSGTRAFHAPATGADPAEAAILSNEDMETFQLFTTEMFDPSIFEGFQQSPVEGVVFTNGLWGNDPSGDF